MNVRKLLNACAANLDRMERFDESGAQPQETEIWGTRDGKHRVQILLRDPVRPDHQYPLTGVVITPENGGDFKVKQNVLYPRFTRSGGFTTNLGQEHSLDLVYRIA